MIRRNDFNVLNGKTHTDYWPRYCTLCPLYECDRIQEFREDDGLTDGQNVPIVKARVTLISRVGEETTDGGDKPVIRGKIVSANRKPVTCPKKFECSKIDCGHARVSDGIGDHYQIDLSYCENEHRLLIKSNNDGKWEPNQPVFICAPTGQGKNYFIENTLIPYVRKLNISYKTSRKILILSNRLALKQQLKDRLKVNGDITDTDDGIYSYGEYADVMTYQSVLNHKDWLQKEQENSAKYLFVVCDEAHFFTSDASFNPDTEKILRAIVSIFKGSIRIYMSATPYECLRYITEHEINNESIPRDNNSLSGEQFIVPIIYHFQHDYSYLDVKAYSEMEELYDTIIQSVANKEKWLIFIDDRKKCAELKTKLEEYEKDNSPNDINIIAYAVNAKSKQEADYQKILLNESLGKFNVLISTSVLDNGVNLRDVDHIVVSDISKVKVLQMLGRARVQRDEDTGEFLERKTLYIKRFDKEFVDNRLRDLMRQEDAYHRYDVAFGHSIDHPQPFENGAIEKAVRKHIQGKSGYAAYDRFIENLHKPTLPMGQATIGFLTHFFHSSFRNWENATHWFSFSSESPFIHYNEIAKDMLKPQIAEYERILAEMKASRLEGEKRVGQRYLEIQFSWFEKAYCTDEDITYMEKDKARNEVVAFFDKFVTQKIHIEKEEQRQFGEDVAKLFEAAFGPIDPNKNRTAPGKAKINNVLVANSLPYKIESNKDSSEGPTYWLVKRTQPE